MTTQHSVIKRVDRLWANHETQVLHDDGVYRHIYVSFNLNSSFPTWVYVVTWHGYLSITGDLTDGWTFDREKDMLRDFFHASSADSGGWLPIDYWAEKLTATGKRACRAYDEDAWREWAFSVFEDARERGEISADECLDYCEQAASAAMWEHDALVFTRDVLIDDFGVEWEDAVIDTYTDDFVRSCHLVYRIAREYRKNTARKEKK